MKIVNKKTAAVLAALFFCLLWSGVTLAAAAKKSVAILPFKLNAPPDQQYLKEGFRDMLGSRITAETGAIIVPKTTIDAALKGSGGKLVVQNMGPYAQRVGADYLVFGTITALGGGISIDASVFSAGASADQAVNTFFASATASDQVMQAIDTLSWDIIEKYFNKKRPVSRVATVQSAPAQGDTSAFTTTHPDKTFLATGGAGSIRGGRNFVKTRTFDMPLASIDLGDVDGDGKVEVILANRTEVQVFRRDGTRLNLIETIPMGNRYQVHNVNSADLNGNGRDEIYISAADSKGPGSKGVEWDGTRFVELFKNVRWYIKPINIPDIGEVLVGQSSDIAPVVPGLYQLSYNGKTLIRQERLSIPREINLFNFTYADLDGDGQHEIVALDESFKLTVYKSGSMVWRSVERFAGTRRFLGGEPDMTGSTRSADLDEIDGVGDQYRETYVPSRILVSDVDKDGMDDVIINRNPETLSTVVPRMIQYPNGTMVGLKWNGIGLEELWRTRKIDGYVIDYQVKSQVMKVGPENEDELFVGLILNAGTLDSLIGDKSTVVIYPFQFEMPDEKN
jgi:TolB-like protein